MRILILGGDGMLGHQLLRRLRAGHEVRATLRQQPAAYAAWPMFDAQSACFGVDVRAEGPLDAVFAEFRPEAVINAVGIVKQRQAAIREHKMIVLGPEKTSLPDSATEPAPEPRKRRKK